MLNVCMECSALPEEDEEVIVQLAIHPFQLRTWLPMEDVAAKKEASLVAMKFIAPITPTTFYQHHLCNGSCQWNRGCYNLRKVYNHPWWDLLPLFHIGHPDPMPQQEQHQTQFYNKTCLRYIVPWYETKNGNTHRENCQNTTKQQPCFLTRLLDPLPSTDMFCQQRSQFSTSWLEFVWLLQTFLSPSNRHTQEHWLIDYSTTVLS